MNQTSEKIDITIDGVSAKVSAGISIVDAAREIDSALSPPTMCYYSKLENSGGRCRTCLVEVVKSSKKDPRPMPKLVPGCRTQVMDGMEIRISHSDKVSKEVANVTELLLINHPLDCPVCDQAGECKLQDLSYEHGKSFSNYEFQKRTTKADNFGPYIKLNMNRCILCARCVLVANQLTSQRNHGILYRGDHAEISTYINHAITNDFSGNMIDVCPVGALTDNTFRFKSRVWFTNPVLAQRHCEKCSGKVVLWMKDNEVLRVTARKDKNNEVEEFICNECRFETKKMDSWTIEKPEDIHVHSVVSVNQYKNDVPKIQKENALQIQKEIRF